MTECSTGIQRWRRLGRIYEPQPTGGWYASHAAYPTALLLGGTRVRIFFSVRDGANRSSIASLDMNIDGDRVERAGDLQGPLLSPGPGDAFDRDGVTVGCVIPNANRLHLYYLGWRLGSSPPFMNFIGLAFGDLTHEPFRRAFEAPVVGRSQVDPYCVTYPYVLRDGDAWRMWYGSHLCWDSQDSSLQHVIREARSTNGLEWTPSANVLLGVAGTSAPAEFALTRPSVMRDANGWSMWFARRLAKYRLGYAFSRDGAVWHRADHVLTFDGHAEDWEADEQAYPCVFDLMGERYMLYCGAGYGSTGFGLAVLRR